MNSTTHPSTHAAAIPDAVVNQLLGQLLHSSEPLHRILESLELSARQLAAWLHESDGLQMIKDLTELAHARARLIATDALSSAINTLTLIATDTIQSPRHAETIRKAATTLIRLATAKQKPAPDTNVVRVTDPACPEVGSAPASHQAHDFTASSRDDAARRNPSHDAAHLSVSQHVRAGQPCVT